MALIVLASDKGSPGVTTTSVALAGVWPRRAILAECDPSGGDLVYRSPAENGGPLNPNIGMLSLATMARHGLSAHQLGDHLQRIHGGLEIVAGLATGDQSAGLTGLWPHLGRAFDALPETDVIADCGRVEAGSASLELMAGAALVVLVARTSAEQIAHVRDRALSMVQRIGGGNALSSGGLGVPIGVLLIVDPKQRGRVTAQVDELLRNSGLPVKVIGTIADDSDGADLLNGRGRGRLDKTLLIRSAREVSLELYRRFATAAHQGSASGRPAAPGGPAGPSAGGPAGPGTGTPNRAADRPPPPRPAGSNDGRTLNDRDPAERTLNGTASGGPAGGLAGAPAGGSPRPNDAARTSTDRDPIPGGIVRPSAPTFDGPTVRTPLPVNGFGDSSSSGFADRPVPPFAASHADTNASGFGDRPTPPFQPPAPPSFQPPPFQAPPSQATTQPTTPAQATAPPFADNPTTQIPTFSGSALVASPTASYGPPPATAPDRTGRRSSADGFDPRFDPRSVPPADRPADFDTRPGAPAVSPDPQHGVPTGFDASSNSFDPAVPTGRRALPPSDRDRDRDNRPDRAAEPTSDPTSPWEPPPRPGGHRAGPPSQGPRG